MEDMLRVAALGVAAALCAVVVKRNVQELGIVLALAAGAVILAFAFGAIDSIRTLLDRLRDLAGLAPSVLKPVIKTVGIAILTKIAAEVCKDAKEGGIASFVELAGASLALFTALPLLEAVLDAVIGLL